MEITIETRPTAEELLRKIQKLEQGHAHLKHKLSNLINNNDSHRHRSNSSQNLKTDSSPYSLLRREIKLSESEYVNILQSIGQSVYMFDINNRIVYWNKMSENLYGYTVVEALGKTAPDIIIESRYSELAIVIIQRAVKGETWSGQFPVRTKYGEKFTVITTLSPCHDENGTTFGVTCVCTDARQFRKSTPQASVSAPRRISSGLDSYQPLQTAICSKISNLASKVKMKMKTGETNLDHDSDFAPGTPTGKQFTRMAPTASNEGSENEPRFHKVLFLKAEAWMGKKGISWPLKGNENGDGSNIRSNHFGSPWLHNNQEQESGPQTSSSDSLKLESQLCDSNSIIKTDIHIENLDVEISWDDLTIKGQIGQDSRGTVYHALLYGSDVAVKIYNKQEYPDDVILFFRKEVCLMKRLRHPNILLFMGAVISPQHLCIVTEFLPRGSLFGLLKRGTTKLDWRCRVHMAVDIARGMNYLHHCQPPIIHRNLKSSNLLVDKTLTLKVGDFGLSRIKHGTYLATNTGAGMPQWMAPETLRNEHVDEKSDVYSYGVVLWEITTGKIPWENVNSMQVIGAVGYMNQRLEIPNDVDPQWASLIESCWSSEPRSRPTFKEILVNLKELQKKF